MLINALQDLLAATRFRAQNPATKNKERSSFWSWISWSIVHSIFCWLILLWILNNWITEVCGPKWFLVVTNRYWVVIVRSWVRLQELPIWEPAVSKIVCVRHAQKNIWRLSEEIALSLLPELKTSLNKISWKCEVKSWVFSKCKSSDLQSQRNWVQWYFSLLGLKVQGTDGAVQRRTTEGRRPNVEEWT